MAGKLGCIFLVIFAVLLLFKSGFALGYAKGWNANEATLIDAWVKYYDVESKGSYWDNREVDK